MQDKNIVSIKYNEKGENLETEELKIDTDSEMHLYERYVDLDVFVAKKHPNLGYRKHFHKAIELYYILQGQMIAKINEVSRLVRQGEMFLVNSFELHEYEKSDDTKVLVLLISSHYYGNFSMVYPNKVLPNFMDSIAFNRQVLPLLETVYERLNELTELEAIGYTNLILGMLVKEYGVIERKNSNNVIIKIIEYIYDNYRKDISIATVAQELNYANASISRIFRNGVGGDFRVYVNNVRVEKAHQMLMDEKNDDTMTRIATENGFNSMTSFYRAYKRKFGCLPQRHQYLK